MIGRNLSHYEVLEELGRGGMGVVYKARDTSLDRLVALKLLPPELANDPKRVALLRREAKASARLNHPRIVTIHTVEEAEGQLFLTMEYVEGRTLAKAIPKGGLDLDRFFRIAIPLADAVATAHAQRIVHRDLKPANIVLSEEDRPKILDFGLARLRPEDSTELHVGTAPPAERRAVTQLETLAGGRAGTLPYMSPEQLSGRPVDHRTDIFSLGIVLYEMATGLHPYRSREGSIVSAILEDRPDSVADVRGTLPRQLGRIIGRCLEKRPEDRIQSARDLCSGLMDLKRELDTAPGPRTPRRWPRRRALPAVAAAVAAVMAIGGWLLMDRFAARTPPSPIHMGVQEDRIFPGERGPDYLRRGFVEALRRGLGGLESVYVVGERGPSPDLTVIADVRVAGDTTALAFRLVDPMEGVELGDGVLAGRRLELQPLASRAARAIAATLRDRLGREVAYRAARAPTDDRVALDLYLQAAAALSPAGESLDLGAVRELLRQAIQRDPGFALAHLLEGRTYLQEHAARPEAGRAAAAEASCSRAAEEDPQLGAAYTCLGTALMLQEERALDAVAALTRAIELDTSDLTPHLSLRDAYLDLGMPKEAENTWRAAIREHPSYWAGYYSLGTYYQDVERYEEALAEYQRALELAPREPDVYSFLGTTYFYLGRYEEGIVALERSIAIRPTREAYYNLGGIYFALRRFEAAVAAYQEAVRLDEADYAARGRLGWACFWAPGRRQEAPEHLRRAIALAPADDPGALIMSALFRALLGEREPSLEALDAALELQPNDAHYFYLAGLTMNHLGDTDAALDWLGRALRGGWSTAEIRTTIDLENLHHDPRFQQLLRDADSRQDLP